MWQVSSGRLYTPNANTRFTDNWLDNLILQMRNFFSKSLHNSSFGVHTPNLKLQVCNLKALINKQTPTWELYLTRKIARTVETPPANKIHNVTSRLI